MIPFAPGEVNTERLVGHKKALDFLQSEKTQQNDFVLGGRAAAEQISRRGKLSPSFPRFLFRVTPSGLDFLGEN